MWSMLGISALLLLCANPLPANAQNAAMQLNNMLSQLNNVGSLKLFNEVPGAASVEMPTAGYSPSATVEAMPQPATLAGGSEQAAAEQAGEATQDKVIEAEERREVEAAAKVEAALPGNMQPLNELKGKGADEDLTATNAAFSHIQVMQANVREMDSLVQAQKASVEHSKEAEAKLQALIATNEAILKENQKTLKESGKELLDAVTKYTGDINGGGGSGNGSGEAATEAPAFLELSESLEKIQAMIPDYLNNKAGSNPVKLLKARRRKD